MLTEDFGKQKYIPWTSGEKLRIAVMYQVASYWPSIESFYAACMADQDVEVRIFYIDDMSVERVQVESSGDFLERKGISYEIYSEEKLLEYRPHAALYQPPYDTSYRNPDALSLHLLHMGIRILYIPYGVEIADTEDAHYNHFFTYVIRNSWRIYTFSDIMREDYFQYCPNRHAVRALGHPRFDSLFGRTVLPEEEMERLAGGRKVILWKMHFPKLIYEGMKRRQVTPSLAEYVKFAEHLERYEDLFFVVMPHPLFFSETIDRGLAVEAQKLLRLLETKENVWIDREEDYRRALYHSDAIIVDRSALMVEAGLFGVPVLYMKNGDYEEPLTRGVFSLINSYEQGTKAEDMDQFVQHFRAGELGSVARRIAERRKEVIPYVDGKCGERILADIKQGIREPEEEAVRIAFFGASLICEHYMERLGILGNPAFRVLGLYDNDPAKWGRVHAGLKTSAPERLKEEDFDILVIMSEQFYMPIKKKLVYELFLDEDKIFRLDEFAERYQAYLEKPGKVYIVGAASRGKAVKGYLDFLYPELSVEAFLVDTLEGNDSFVDGIPVREMTALVCLNPAFPVLIATKGIYHAQIEKTLKERGAKRIIPVSAKIDSAFRNAYVQKYYRQEGMEFVKIDELPSGEAALPTGEEKKTSLQGCIYMAKSVYDRPLAAPYECPAYERAIQVGAALTDRRLEQGILTDDTGENISAKNRQFCELTGLYWIWKHAGEDVIGLSHYRRHFLLPPDWLDIMEKEQIDMILPVPAYIAPSIGENYRERHDASDWDFLLSYLRTHDPEAYALAEKVFAGNLYFTCNMFIMRKEILDGLCGWLFPILEAVADHGGEKEDAYGNRYPGFVSERLMTLYFCMCQRKYRIVYADKNFLS